MLNAPDMWVRANGVFDSFIDPEFLAAAQRIIADRTRRFTDEQLLDRLTVLLGEKGCLYGLLIDEVEDCRRARPTASASGRCYAPTRSSARPAREPAIISPRGCAEAGGIEEMADVIVCED